MAMKKTSTLCCSFVAALVVVMAATLLLSSCDAHKEVSNTYLICTVSEIRRFSTQLLCRWMILLLLLCRRRATPTTSRTAPITGARSSAAACGRRRCPEPSVTTEATAAAPLVELRRNDSRCL
uniref:Secreted protein n=1 Tax=Triticum urartu TaxID=4572 RepID=A0A8R7PNL6_TRIUA